MAFHYKSGGYVGGCGAQIGGLILIIVIAAIFTIIPPKLGDVIWTIFKSIPLVIIAIIAFLYFVGLIIDYRDKKQEQEKNK